MPLDLNAAWRTVQDLGTGFIASLPRLLLAALVIAVFYVIGRTVRSVFRRFAQRRGESHALELALGRILQAAILLLGVMVAFTAAFPSFTPANLVSTLGIGGVAIGFAFKDIFQNFLAGLLILFTRPFAVGDQIVFGAYEGTVEDIQTRATYVKTYDGRRVIIPNGELFTSSVTVNTAFAVRRWEYDVGIGYGDDIDVARRIILDVLADNKQIVKEPEADVIVVALADFSVNLRARWWTSSNQKDGLRGQDFVLTAIKRELTKNGIDLPFPTQQLLLHNQTEPTDSDRSRQREGWPAAMQARPEPREANDKMGV